MVPNITQLFLDHYDDEKELLVLYDTFMARNSESDKTACSTNIFQAV